MSRHKIHWYRSGSTNGMDWEDEQEITFEFRPGSPDVMYLRNGDPGYPGYPAEVEFVSVTPGAGDAGGFTDMAQRALEDEAQTWLSSEGYAAALEVVAEDHEAAREYAADLRADR